MRIVYGRQAFSFGEGKESPTMSLGEGESRFPRDGNLFFLPLRLLRHFVPRKDTFAEAPSPARLNGYSPSRNLIDIRDFESYG